MQLRDYQQEAVDAILKDFSVPGNSVCVAATGAGKSLIIAEVARRLAPEPLLILSPSKEITEQNLEKLSRHFTEIGVYSASMGSKTIKQVTLATILSVYQQPELFTQFKHVLIDEAHTVGVDSDATTYMKFLSDIGVPKVVGLTATPFRMAHTYLPPTFNKMATTTKVITRIKGKREECFWNRIIINITTEFLIERGYLCKPTYYDNSTVTHEHIPTNKSASDFNLEAYAEMILPDEENYLHTIKRLGDMSKSVLVFCLSVEQAARFSQAIVGGAVVSALTPKKERERIIAGFRDHSIKYVFNVATMTTGFDHPALDAIVLIRPTRSLALYCVDEQTEILTSSGWKKDIKAGEVVASFIPETEEIKYVTADYVHNLRNLSKDEFFVSFKSQSSDIRVSNKHRMLYKNKNSKQWNFKEAENLMKLRDGAKLPCAGFKKSQGVPLTPDELRFIGWVMTDGCINKTTGAVSITQGKHQPHLEEIEKMLIGCGFKFTRSEYKRNSQFKSSSLCVRWTISKGKPRATNKHLRGWGDLEPFMSKDMHTELMNLTTDQFDILIEAIHLGDGAKQLNQNWARRSFHISSARKIFAERLQIMAIHHGYRASISLANYNKKPLYIIHLKKQNWMRIGSQYDGRPTFESEYNSNDKVWCVTNSIGTIVTRRNGKVTIMGNCQMVGRGMRIAPGKETCRVIDFSGTVKSIGHAETIKVIKRGRSWELESARCANWHGKILYIFER